MWKRQGACHSTSTFSRRPDSRRGLGHLLGGRPHLRAGRPAHRRRHSATRRADRGASRPSQGQRTAPSGRSHPQLLPARRHAHSGRRLPTSPAPVSLPAAAYPKQGGGSQAAPASTSSQTRRIAPAGDTDVGAYSRCPAAAQDVVPPEPAANVCPLHCHRGHGSTQLQGRGSPDPRPGSPPPESPTGVRLVRIPATPAPPYSRTASCEGPRISASFAGESGLPRGPACGPAYAHRTAARATDAVGEEGRAPMASALPESAGGKSASQSASAYPRDRRPPSHAYARRGRWRPGLRPAGS